MSSEKGIPPDPRPNLAGVVGWPVAHSKSPRIFAHWFAAEGICGHYVALPVQADDFSAVVRALPKMGFRGVNVTVPHKLAALQAADRVTETAKAIGAANVLRFEADGTTTADNSDAFGFAENLRRGAPNWDPAKAPALVLGAGGASRAVLYALLDMGVPKIRLTNRTSDRAVALAGDFGHRVTAVPWEDRETAEEGTGLIVNATSLGMTGQPPLDMRLDSAPTGALVTDLVYAPLETPLLAAARRRGLPTVDGLGMLLHQARPAFRAWFGVDPTVDDRLRQICLAPAEG